MSPLKEKMRGVVLRTVRYSDCANIVSVYTDGCGMMSFAVGQGATRGARLRQAALLPLSIIEMEVSRRAGRELATMSNVRRAVPMLRLYADPARNAVGLFVADVLCHTIVEQERNDVLYGFVERSVVTLDGCRAAAVPNFHICFLYRLGALLGIEPDVNSYREGYWFDMAEGVFVASGSGLRHGLPPQQAAMVRLLARMTPDNMHLFRFTRSQRNEVLDTALTYYGLHQARLGSMKSPEVLRQLFV